MCINLSKEQSLNILEVCDVLLHKHHTHTYKYSQRDQLQCTQRGQLTWKRQDQLLTIILKVCDLLLNVNHVCTHTHVTPVPTDTLTEMGEAGSVTKGL